MKQVLSSLSDTGVRFEGQLLINTCTCDGAVHSGQACRVPDIDMPRGLPVAQQMHNLGTAMVGCPTTALGTATLLRRQG
jgi:hypothetical protein